MSDVLSKWEAEAKSHDNYYDHSQQTLHHEDYLGMQATRMDAAKRILALIDLIRQKDVLLKEIEWNLLIVSHNQHIKAKENVKKAIAFTDELK